MSENTTRHDLRRRFDYCEEQFSDAVAFALVSSYAQSKDALSKCIRELRLCEMDLGVLALSEAEALPKPPTREGGGVRVERFDGLHVSEANGTASAIKGEGAGKATKPGAAVATLRDENSQLPDGLPRRGDAESERSCETCGYQELDPLDEPCVRAWFRSGRCNKWSRKIASVQPINRNSRDVSS